MAVTKKAPVRPKRTKSEVQHEFDDIQQEVSAARETANRKAAEAGRIHDSEVRQAVQDITPESVVTGISALGRDIGRTLSDLSDKITAEVQRLQSVREAVRLEQEELTRLHKIDVAATALDQLVQDYQREKERLESDISTRRSEWEEEVRTTERDRKEVEDQVRKQRQREIDEYEYKKALERKKAQDKYDEEQRLLEKRNKERQEELERSWQLREVALKDREDELARLRADAAAFNERLEKERHAAAAEATKEAERRFEQQILVLKKDNETEKRVSDLQIKSLELTIAKQAEQLGALQKQLDEAKQQVQEIAVRAIEGASGAKALTHINQIAMEQAKNRPQG
jgi:colicin import membrane protein